MNSKGKGIITAVIVVLIALAAFCGFGYISQRMTDDGEIYCTKYAVLAKQEKYTQGLKVIERALKQKELENKKEVLFARISAYESMFDFDTAYRYAKAYVKAYPKDANGKKELTFLETR